MSNNKKHVKHNKDKRETKSEKRKKKKQTLEEQKEEFEKTTEKCLLDTKEFFELKIKDAMKKRSWDVPIIEKNREILEVIAILCTNDHVWVVENLKKKRIIGVITEHDLLHALRPIKRQRFFGVPSRKGLGLSIFETAEHIMTPDPFVCRSHEKVREVLLHMEAHGIRRMPVVNANDELISEVTVHQLIKEFYNVIKPLCEIPDEKKNREELMKKF
jgi:predicted transcriptional regulator